MFLGLGIPFALLLLPRAAWHEKTTVLALAFALGPAVLTTWAFILGTIGGRFSIALLRFELIFTPMLILSLLAAGFAWIKRKRSQGTVSSAKTPYAHDELFLMALIALSCLLIGLVTAYWTFTAYDTLWVYGYLGKVFSLNGYIPESIGYYPQFIPLQYAFMQFAGISDHAARVVVPFYYLASILAAYHLGNHLFSRRVAIFTAAIWALYPQLTQWAQSGDLEIPLTFLFTLSSSYFLQAWLEEEKTLRRRYALIAGLCFGIAMWTKPTAGAFIYGVVLLLGLNFLLIAFKNARFNLKELWRLGYPRFEVALITGLACIPLGSIWYLRNILLGLPALVFPHPNWLSLATRSGDLLSWPLLALFLLLAYLAATRKLENASIVLLGTLLVLAGALPSSPLFDPSRRDAPMSYIRWYEALAIVVGLVLIAWNLRKYPFPKKIAWAYLLALPYFLTWFWSYSYHARLSFAIVPLLILPTAAVLAHLKITWKWPWFAIISVFSAYGLAMPIFGIAPSYDWLWTNRYPDDHSKYLVHNADVYQAALYISGYQSYYGITPVVIAPGEQRLRFFFPEINIITDTVPTNYDELAGATHFLYGTLARWRYEDEAIPSHENRLVSSLERHELFKRVYDFRDGNFVYELYELNLDWRFDSTAALASVLNSSDEVLFNNEIKFIGASNSHTQMAGNKIFLNFLWQPLTQIHGDYFLRLSLFNTQDNTVYATWDYRFNEGREIEYSSYFWETGEYILTPHLIELERPINYPLGANIYRLLVNLIDSETGNALPISINGEEAASYPLESLFSIGE